MTDSRWQQYHSSKASLRKTVWDRLQQQNIAIGSPHGHIPNFIGAIAAADRLKDLAQWQQAAVIKCNPDKPQAPVRQRALADGKTLYMAVPRLIDEACFVSLRLEQLPPGLDLAIAAEKNNVLKYGEPALFAQMQPIDIAVVGCVAVSLGGGRTGKGAGFADLELAMLQHFNLVDAETTIATTVHAQQLVEDLPLESHDWPLDVICTPTQSYFTNHTQPLPQGLSWQKIRPEQWQTIPVLKTLKQDTPA